MKIDTLTFIQHLLQGQSGPADAAALDQHSPVLVPIVIHCVGDPFYKISSEALLVLETLVKVLRPVPEGTNEPVQPPEENFKKYIKQVRGKGILLLQHAGL